MIPTRTRTSCPPTVDTVPLTPTTALSLRSATVVAGLVRLITEGDSDLVLNAIVGSAGLVPTVAALGEGIDLALANKESLVVGGELVTQLAEATGAAIIPVDSEHSALHQLIGAEARLRRYPPLVFASWVAM